MARSRLFLIRAYEFAPHYTSEADVYAAVWGGIRAGLAPSDRLVGQQLLGVCVRLPHYKWCIGTLWSF